MSADLMTLEDALNVEIRARMAAKGYTLQDVADRAAMPLHSLERRLILGMWSLNELRDVWAVLHRPGEPVGVSGLLRAAESRAGIEVAR